MGLAGRPVLELLVGPRVPAGVEAVLVRAARRCAPRYLGGATGGDGSPGATVAARLATSLDAPGLTDAAADPSVPLALVVDRAGAGPELLARADVLLAAADVPLDGPAAVLTLPAVDPERHRPVPPFVRAGWRRRLGFPDEFVVAFGFAPATSVGTETVATVLALASAAAVRGEHTLLAMALGTPVVTNAATAGRLGLADGDQVVVTDGDAVAAARELAGRAADCARLGRRAREHVEAHHAPEAVARAMLGALGLTRPGDPDPDAGAGSAAILYSACRELGLPPDGSLYAYRLLVAGRMERAPR